MRSWVKWSICLIAVFVLLLASAAIDAADPNDPLEISLADADMTLVGEGIADWTGYFGSPAGDVNGDGLGDALIGAPMGGNMVCPWPEDPCSVPLRGEGLAYLVLGRSRQTWPPDPVNLVEADASFLGCFNQSMTARQVYTAGDVNGDGYDDLLVSGWNCGVNHAGKSYLFLGRPDVESWGRHFPVESADASFVGEHDWDFLSYYNATVGDVNGDGLDDFLVTCTQYDISATEVITDAGKAYLFLGREEADWGPDYPAAMADATFLGEGQGDHLGRSAVGVGDVNGDGYGDFLIGAADNDYGGVDAGQDYLFLGRATPNDPDYDPTRPWWGLDYPVAQAGASFVGEAEGDRSGQRVAGAGDVNNDGYSDMLMSAARSDQVDIDAGKAYLVLGRPEADWGMRYPLALADASFLGEAANDEAGRRVGGIGDANNDGYDDFVIGAPHSSQSGTLAGLAYLIYGRPEADWGRDLSLAQADVKYMGKPEVGSAGYDMAGLDDFDGDGVDDFLLTAYGGRHEADVPGEVYILLGAETPRPYKFIPDSPEGYVRDWRRFKTAYTDPNGPDDLNTVQMLLGRSTDDPMGLDVSYHNLTATLSLRGSAETCAPGDPVRLSNGVVELGCKDTSAYVGPTGVLWVMWRARWLQPPTDPASNLDLNAYLRAVDQAGHDSGYQDFGLWTLKWQDLAIYKTVAPSTMITAGIPLTYTLTFSNLGATVAASVTITDIVPTKLLNISFTSNRPITLTGTISYTWLVGSLEPAQGGIITITGLVDPQLPRNSAFTNVAIIDADAIDGNPDNNRSSVRVMTLVRIYLPLVLK